MPDPQDYQDEKEWMAACVPKVLEDGTAMDQDQAVAMCMSMWREKKSADESPEDETVVAFGGEVKALGDGGKFGGYLVRWGNPEDTDISPERDFFTPKTDFDLEFPAKVTLYWNHGQDPILKRRKLGKVELTMDSVGLWAETILQERDEYEKYIREMGEEGKLGWSSGSASHLVERQPAGKSNWIVMWPIIDASMTHVPAEPRNVVVPLKSLSADPLTLPVNPGRKAIEAQESTVLQGVKTMGDTATLDVEKIVADATEKAATSAAAKAIADFAAKLTTTNAGGFLEVTRDEADIPFSSLGDQLSAVKSATLSQGRDLAPRLKALNIKQLGANELVGSEGGFLLEPTFVSVLLKPLHDSGPFSSRCAKLPIGPNSNSLTVRAVDEKSRATGARWGGIRGYRLAEAGTKQPSEPSFRLMELRLKKYAVLCYATEELLQDTIALAGIIQQGAAEELDFMVNDDICNGDGVAGPLGILQSGALVKVPMEAGQLADTIVTENIFKMWARMHPRSKANAAWYINTDVTPQLYALSLSVGTGGMPMYMGPGSLPNAPSGALLGKPVIETEFNATLGDVGDIILADMSQYVTIDKDVQAASSIHVQFLTDQVAFRFVYRCDGQPKIAAPLVPYKGGGNTLSPFVALAAR